jgi:Asp-tRNA(Asn)/Glu-tRNA(Gln) amidotransferase B subunit
MSSLIQGRAREWEVVIGREVHTQVVTKAN